MSSKRVAIMVFCFLCAAASLHAQIDPLQKCKISGTVTDLSDAILGGGHLFFVNESGTYKMQIRLGKFTIELPEGVYEILADFQKRANLRVSCKDDPPVHIFVLPACVSYGCPKLGFDFDVFQRKGASAYDPNLVIAYDKKRTFRNEITYKKAILTYQNYTIFADELVLDRKLRRASTRGDCWVDDGIAKKKCVDTSLDIAPQILNRDSTMKTVTDVQNERFQHTFFWPASDQ